MKKSLTTVSSVIGIIALLTVPTYSAADPHSDGLSVGKSNLNKLSSKVTSSNAKGMPFYTDKPPQSSQFGSSSLFDVGVGRINTCKTNVPGSDKVANQECDAVNFLAKNPEQKVKFPVNPNDPIISGIGEIINNAKPGPVTDACVTTTTTTPDIYATEVCNEYLLSEAKSCSMGQIVEVDHNTNYQCNITKNILETFECDKALVVTCETPVDGCDNGGIIPGTTQGDMYSKWIKSGNGDYVLQFGSIGDNYWYGGAGKQYNRSLEFTIADVSQITKFTLSSAAYDDYLLVKVNGVRVFNGPYGGSKLALVSRMCNEGRDPCNRVDIGDGNTAHLPELGNSWKSSPNKDLVPYLKDGVNLIETISVVGGGGETAIKMTTRMQCPAKCTFSWDDQCSTLDSRT